MDFKIIWIIGTSSKKTDTDGRFRYDHNLFIIRTKVILFQCLFKSVECLKYGNLVTQLAVSTVASKLVGSVCVVFILLHLRSISYPWVSSNVKVLNRAS